MKLSSLYEWVHKIYQTAGCLILATSGKSLLIETRDGIKESLFSLTFESVVRRYFNSKPNSKLL